MQCNNCGAHIPAVMGGGRCITCIRNDEERLEKARLEQRLKSLEERLDHLEQRLNQIPKVEQLEAKISDQVAIISNKLLEINQLQRRLMEGELTEQDRLVISGKYSCYCHKCAKCCGPRCARIINYLIKSFSQCAVGPST